MGRSAAEAEAAMILLLDQLEMRSCAVMGISAGGPTAIALAAWYTLRANCVILAAALSQPEYRAQEAMYKDQPSFDDPMHALSWAMVGLVSRLSRRTMARQALSIFSIHDPGAALAQLSGSDIEMICRFYRGRSSRKGALNDATH